MKYTSRDKIKSGLPLGGIGSGKVEILPNGGWSAITFQNNANAPMVHPRDREAGRMQGLLGLGFAVHCSSGRDAQAALLQTGKVGAYPTVDSIDFDALWPRAELIYRKKGLPVDVRLTAAGTVRAGDDATSALPAALLRFTVRNRSHRTLKVSLLGMIRNIVGIDEISRINRVEKDARSVSVVCSALNPHPGDATAGEYALTAEGLGATWLRQWNLQKSTFKFDEASASLKAFDLWKETGRLPNDNAASPQCGGGATLGAALAVSRTVKPGATAAFDFVLSWHYPVHHAGHVYEKKIHSAVQAGRSALPRFDEILTAGEQWQKPIMKAPLPAWLKDALWNNLYVLTSTTWWDRKNRFAFYEAPVICPLMGTLDVRYYATVPFVKMFPALEKNELHQFALAQRPNGYIPHDLGRNRLDNPNDGTTFYYWKDLNPKYILQVYRDVLWLNDRAFLRKMYPSARRAMIWSMGTDTNGDGLPDNQGADQTYDVWEFFGTNSYTSSIFLASLLAFERLAEMMSDGEMARRCRKQFEKGRESFVTQLWNGKYFVAGWSEGKVYDSCIAGQLNGQWIAHLLGLGHLFPREKVHTAVRSMMRLNGRDSRYGMTNSVFPDGSRDLSNAHSAGIWPGESYAVAALAIYEGLEKEGLALAEKTWANMWQVQRNPWNQPDVISSADGAFGFGDAYMRNMAVWAVAEALASRHPKIRSAVDAAYRGGE